MWLVSLGINWTIVAERAVPLLLAAVAAVLYRHWHPRRPQG
jgi:hypothetical protein